MTLSWLKNNELTSTTTVVPELGPQDNILNALWSGTAWINPGDTVHRIKLELGPVQTLAHKEGDTWVLNDPPPNKALELLKCQRYFQLFSDENLRPVKAVDFRPAMRVTPALGTIVIDGTTYYTADANL